MRLLILLALIVGITGAAVYQDHSSNFADGLARFVEQSGNQVINR